MALHCIMIICVCLTGETIHLLFIFENNSICQKLKVPYLPISLWQNNINICICSNRFSASRFTNTRILSFVSSALKQKYWMSFCQSLYCQPTNVLPPLYVTEDVTLWTKQDWQQGENINIPHETIHLLVYGSYPAVTLLWGQVMLIEFKMHDQQSKTH